jgi:hypothetical protein
VNLFNKQRHRDIKHLSYNSVNAWIVGENIPMPFSKIEDDKLRDEIFTKFGELRKHLFNKHLEELSETERSQLDTGKHASQSHEHFEVAKTVAKSLAIELSNLKLVTNVFPSLYHMNRIILDVTIDGEPSFKDAAKVIPQFYRGFEIHVVFKK